METERVKQILDDIKNVKIAVYGDFCIDAYWLLDSRGSEVSVETGQQGEAVSKHYYSLGGASNVVANLAALEPAKIQVIGVVGDDIFGRELVRQFKDLGVDSTHMVVQAENFNTVTFGKRYLDGSEKPRIDFGFFNKRSEATDQDILEGFREAFQSSDAIIFNQQIPGSIANQGFIDEINGLFDKYPEKIVLLDSRHYGRMFKNIYRKTNDIEAAQLSGIDAKPDDVLQLKDLKLYAENLYRQSNKPVFLTRGSKGMITVDSQGTGEVSGIQLTKKIDTVGAGDTVTSALALCLGAGLQAAEAAEFANFAAAVTVGKIFQTGTASGPEILEIAADPTYIYQPELAGDRRQARYFEDSEIELCCQDIELGEIRHAVFDHDGTISTLRQGWEEIMAPMMIKAILGDKYETADETVYHKVRNRVNEYIDKSTGIQTILQMELLVEMVRECGIVKPAKILDKFGYKEIYNDALMEMVNRRIEKFKRGELDINDYSMKGSVEFLKALRQRGVKLYLASGTDRKDVLAEAAALGYADMFEGRIYGSVGDVTKYSKKMVIEKIMAENDLQGRQLAVFGDGPVEIQECRKRDGIAVGIASDEIRRHGLDLKKRTRLIKAGSHIIIPDFSQHQKLINLLLPA